MPSRSSETGVSCATGFNPPKPACRRLRVFSIDPSLSASLDTAPISQVTVPLPWGKLDPGPKDEYLEVIDVDPGSGVYYEPVNLEDRNLLAQDGLPPSEGTPQFHQQMVYAVARLTISNFEKALGRRALWGPKLTPEGPNPKDDSVFVQRLRIYPHALREPNAYYSPQKKALLFGYFMAGDDDPGDHMPGSWVFSCLSHDIIAHETTHALVDGVIREFIKPTNPDVLAFHEAFADIVALFQHFTFPEIVRHQISATQGRIRERENLLGELAGQFGRGIGLHTSLRSAIGEFENDTWKPHKPRPGEYKNTTEPHARGAILVAAVFDAFLSIYERRTADLLRLATGGAGILQPGAIHPDLVQRLANEASKSAQHVLTMCIRALDYCPPVDITFDEFLRAIITADFDLVDDDDLDYRSSFVAAFRRRGIYPLEVGTLGVDRLVWRRPDEDVVHPSEELQTGIVRLRQSANENIYTPCREQTFRFERNMRIEIHEWLKQHLACGSSKSKEDAAYLGLDPNHGFEVRSAHIAYRISPDGELDPQLILGLLQPRDVPVDASDKHGDLMVFQGGCTLIADLKSLRIRYCIRKSSSNGDRLEKQQQFAMQMRNNVRATYLGLPPLEVGAEPFAAIHRGV